MFTLRHMDADLLRFDWLPDRGSRQEVRIDRVAASFRFTRHPRHDLPAARLRVLESFVRAKAAELSRM